MWLFPCWLIYLKTLVSQFSWTCDCLWHFFRLSQNSNTFFFFLNLIWHGGRSGDFLPSPPISYTVIKFFVLFYSHKIYFYIFWPNLDKFFAEGHEIWTFCGREYSISRISDTYKKSFICNLLKHRRVPCINNLLLIPKYLWVLWWRIYDVVIDFMTFYDAEISKTCFLPYKVNYDIISQEAWVDS